MENKKAVLITGCDSGVGLQIAKNFLESGCNVIITAKDYALVQTTASQLKNQYSAQCIGVKFEPLNAKTDCQQLFNCIAQKGFVINKLVCAHQSLGLCQNALDATIGEWENVLFENITSSYLVVRGMAKRLSVLPKQDASIVFISSSLYNSAVRGRSDFIASNGGVQSMTRALALDLAKYGIRVNCVTVGALKNDGWKQFDDSQLNNIQATIPLGDGVSEVQVANAVDFLLSSKSSGITGASLVVDGGLDCVIPGAF